MLNSAPSCRLHRYHERPRRMPCSWFPFQSLRRLQRHKTRSQQMSIEGEREEKHKEPRDQSGTESSNRGSLEEDGRRRFFSIGGVHEQGKMIRNIDSRVWQSLHITGAGSYRFALHERHLEALANE